mgnify:CR=1 FL=1
MYEIFEKLLKEYNLTAYKVAKDTGLTTATLTNWKKGRYTPKQDKLQKIAEYFGVSLEYLPTGKEPASRASLTAKDERDIKQALEDFKNRLSTAGVMYDGEPLDEESQAAILAAVELAERTARIAAKEKFTPNKNKK